MDLASCSPAGGESLAQSTARQRPKQLSKTSLLGQKGVALIEQIVLDMGCRWNPSGPLEVGIDGEVELFDAQGNALSKFLLVQSKAHEGPFLREHEHGFEYPCQARDVEYWLKFETPVLLVVSRPATREAYWICIQRYYREAENRRSRVVRFNKAKNRLTKDSLFDLLDDSSSVEPGVPLGPVPHEERLISNLLPVTALPRFIFIAETSHRHRPPIWEAHRAKGGRGGNRFILKNKRVISFDDLEDGAWPAVCDVGTIEKFDTLEWSESIDPERSKHFAELLDATVRDKLYPTARYWKQLDAFVWSAPKPLDTQGVHYSNLKRMSRISAFTKYEKDYDGESRVIYRHMAFRSRFRRLEGTWFLEITPTYAFTRDGRELHRFHSQALAGIKRWEGNRAVLSEVLFWADRLQRSGGLFEPRGAAVLFGELQDVKVPYGILDSLWRKSDPATEALEAPPPETDWLFDHVR
jgi:hypothetical protein